MNIESETEAILYTTLADLFQYIIFLHEAEGCQYSRRGSGYAFSPIRHQSERGKGQTVMTTLSMREASNTKRQGADIGKGNKASVRGFMEGEHSAWKVIPMMTASVKIRVCHPAQNDWIDANERNRMSGFPVINRSHYS
jgi:hypothetical protein